MAHPDRLFVPLLAYIVSAASVLGGWRFLVCGFGGIFAIPHSPPVFFFSFLLLVLLKTSLFFFTLGILELWAVYANETVLTVSYSCHRLFKHLPGVNLTVAGRSKIATKYY